MKVSEREKRYLSVTLISALLFLVYKLILGPVITSEGKIKEELVAKEKLLDKYHHFLDEKGQAEEQ